VPWAGGLALGTAAAVRRARNGLATAGSTIYRAILLPGARSFANLQAVHSEGCERTFKQTLGFCASIPGCWPPSHYLGFEDGLRRLHILDAVFGSSQRRPSVNTVPG
jgi:hypothetical protein